MHPRDELYDSLSSSNFDTGVLKAVKKILDENKRRRSRLKGPKKFLNKTKKASSVMLLYKADNHLSGSHAVADPSIPLCDKTHPSWEIPCICGSGWINVDGKMQPRLFNGRLMGLTEENMHMIKSFDEDGGYSPDNLKVLQSIVPSKKEEPVRSRSEYPKLGPCNCWPSHKCYERCHVKSLDFEGARKTNTTITDHYKLLDCSNSTSSSSAFVLEESILGKADVDKSSSLFPNSTIITDSLLTSPYLTTSVSKQYEMIEDSVGKIIRNYAQRNGICCNSSCPNAVYCISPLTYRSPRRNNKKCENEDFFTYPPSSCCFHIVSGFKDKGNDKPSRNEGSMKESKETYELQMATKRLKKLKNLLLMWRDLIKREEDRWENLHGVNLNHNQSNERVVEYMLNLC